MYYRGISEKISEEKTNYFISEKDPNVEKVLVYEKPSVMRKAGENQISGSRFTLRVKSKIPMKFNSLKAAEDLQQFQNT